MGEENGSGSGEPASKKPKSDPTVLEQEFDKETQSALEEIDSCQNEIDAMNEKASEEILKVTDIYILGNLNYLKSPMKEKILPLYPDLRW